MLSLQKSTSDRTGLGYDFSSPSIASTSTTIFVPPTNNVETENNDVNSALQVKIYVKQSVFEGLYQYFKKD